MLKALAMKELVRPNLKMLRCDVVFELPSQCRMVVPLCCTQFMGITCAVWNSSLVIMNGFIFTSV